MIWLQTCGTKSYFYSYCEETVSVLDNKQFSLVVFLFCFLFYFEVDHWAMRTFSLFWVVREYNTVLSCIQMTRNGIEQFTVCKCRGCLKSSMTIAAQIYAFITLKIQFPVSVSAQILGGHKSTLLSTLCLHASHCFFSALSICCFLSSMYYLLLHLGRKLILPKECYSIFCTVYYCQLLKFQNKKM